MLGLVGRVVELWLIAIHVCRFAVMATTIIVGLTGLHIGQTHRTNHSVGSRILAPNQRLGLVRASRLHDLRKHCNIVVDRPFALGRIRSSVRYDIPHVLICELGGTACESACLG